MLKRKILIYGKWLPFIVLVLLSVQTVLFTWNLGMAAYHFRKNKRESARYMISGFNWIPSTYPVFKKFNGPELDNLLVSDAIRKNNTQCLEDCGLKPDAVAELKRKFKNNMYLTTLMAESGDKTALPTPNRQNPDTVSLELLADQTMNTRSQEVLAKYGKNFDVTFLINLADYCQWKRNEPLAEFIKEKLAAKSETSGTNAVPPAWNPPLPPGIDYRRSVEILDRKLTRHFKINGRKLGANLIHIPAFQIPAAEDKWFLSHMANREPFSEGSFTMGLDMQPLCNNGYLRIMGFHASHTPGKSRPRGGAWYREPIKLKQGFYCLAFDYATLRLGVKPSIHLHRDLKEIRLPDSDCKWRKVVFILDNSENRLQEVKPLIRMWGTGTLAVDNIYFARIDINDMDLPPSGPLLVEEG